MSKQTSFTFPLDERQQNELISLLEAGNYLPVRVEYTRYAARTPDFSIAIYNKGKCLVQGKGAADFVQFILEPNILQTARVGYETELDPTLSEPHMGVDESGKGDLFGPLVVAAAYVDPELYETFKELNVRDSKRITSDKAALKMGRELRQLLGNRFAVVKIGPRAYNRLYARMRNVNKLLAWGHARAIENLLASVPDCPRAISDQFGAKSQVERALMQKAQKIELVQRHKAESDPAVAAASVIAREQFLLALKEMSEKTGLNIPKGASAAVREVAAELARKQGPAALTDHIKCHFKTTDEVLRSMGLERSVLGPDGQATSKPFPGRNRSGSQNTEVGSQDEGTILNSGS